MAWKGGKRARVGESAKRRERHILLLWNVVQMYVYVCVGMNIQHLIENYLVFLFNNQ